MIDPLEILKSAIKKAQTIRPNAALPCIVATITDINDPLLQGRCKVSLYNFSSPSGQSFQTDWCDTLTLKIAKGLLPKNLIGKSVLAFPIMESYENIAVNLGRPLIYSSDENLPEACLENLGVNITVLGKTESFATVCLLRNGKFSWIKQCDLLHGHATGDSQAQDPDTSFDFQKDVEQEPIHSTVFSTAVTNYIPNTGFLPPLLND